MKQRLFYLFTYLFVLLAISSPELYAQSGGEEDDGRDQTGVRGATAVRRAPWEREEEEEE